MGDKILIGLVTLALLIAVLCIVIEMEDQRNLMRLKSDCPIASVAIGDFWGKGDLVEQVADVNSNFVWLSNGDVVKRVKWKNGCVGFEVEYYKISGVPVTTVDNGCFIGVLK